MSNEPLTNTGKKSNSVMTTLILLSQKLKGHTPYTLIQKLMSQPTLRTTAVFAISGFAFAMGTLLLARTMQVEEFGNLALAIALFNVFGLLAPIGIDQILLRHKIDPGPRLLMRLILTGTAVGLLVGLGFMWATGVQMADAAAVWLSIVSGGVVATLVALSRSYGQEGYALLLATAASWILLAIGLLSLVLPPENASLYLLLFALGNLAAAIWGWLQVSNKHRVPHHEQVKIPWNEAFSLLGIAAIGTLAIQFERLIIPATIGIEALALFSVIASVAIFPFRLLTASAGFSLVPKLRATTDARLRRKLVRIEFFSIISLLLASTIIIVAVAPFAIDLLTGGRYQIGFNIAIAACLNGSGKVFQALPRAVLTGCGNEKEIAKLNRLGALGLCTTIVGALLGAQWGLVGLLYGVAIGSMIANLPAMLLARSSLRP